MKPTICHYATIQFMPYVETGEFANVGILLVAPEHRYLNFMLERKRYGRLTGFFPELDPDIYRHVISDLQEELNRLNQMIERQETNNSPYGKDAKLPQKLFAEIIRPRESMLRFGPPSVTITDQPALKLKELFGYYVVRNFLEKKTHETMLEAGIRQMLHQENIGNRFRRQKVGDDTYCQTFPFVES